MCLLTTPSTFLLPGAPDSGISPKVLTTDVDAEAVIAAGHKPMGAAFAVLHDNRAGIRLLF